MKIKKWFKLQKEGILVGALWGVMSLYASVGMASLPSIAWWQKVLILPTVIADKVLNTSNPYISLFAVALVGAIIGSLIDMVYKPND
jgi:hypothetical protein